MAQSPGVVARPAGAQRRSPRHKARGAGQDLIGYLLVLPFLAFFVVFQAYPVVYGVYVSLHHWNPIVGNGGWVGFRNYALLLFDHSALFSQQFWQGMLNTVLFVFISVPFLLLIPFVVAYTIYRSPAKGLFRSLYFFPATLSATAVTSIWSWLLQTQGGEVNTILGAHIPWLVEQPWAWISIDLVTVWWTLGFNMVILYAGMTQISTTLFDAAAIDGAGSFAMTWNITLPQLRRVIAFVVIISTIASFNLFAQPYLMTQGGPGFSTSPITMFIYGVGFNSFHMGTATAMAMLMAVILAAIAFAQYRFVRGGEVS